MSFSDIYQLENTLGSDIVTVKSQGFPGGEEKIRGRWILPPGFIHKTSFLVTAEQHGLMLGAVIDKTIYVYFGSFMTGTLLLLREIRKIEGTADEWHVGFAEGYRTVGVWVSKTPMDDPKAMAWYWTYDISRIHKSSIPLSQGTVDLERFSGHTDMWTNWVVPIFLTNNLTFILQDKVNHQIILLTTDNKLTTIPFHNIVTSDEIHVMSVTHQYIYLFDREPETMIRVDYINKKVVTVTDIAAASGIFGAATKLFFLSSTMHSLHTSRMVFMGLVGQETVLTVWDDLQHTSTFIVHDLVSHYIVVLQDLIRIEPNYFKNKQNMRAAIGFISTMEWKLMSGMQPLILASPPPYHELPMYPKVIEQLINSYL